MPATVTTKGQITIPKEVRDYLGIKPGSTVGFRRGSDGEVVVFAQNAAAKTSRYRKALGHAGPGLSTDELMKLLRGDD